MNATDKIIEKYNNGKVENFLTIFSGDIQLFYKFIDKKGNFESLDYDTPETEEYYNQYLYFLSNLNPEKFLEIASDSFVDIKNTEDMEYYISVPDFSDFAKLFCESRNSLSPKPVETILNGEIIDYWFDYTTDDLYRDVIEVLTSENLQLLFEAIISEQKIISADTELLEEIAEEQNNNENLELNLENLPEIFRDEESAKSVLSQLEDQGSEIKSKLYNIHEGSYNNAYYDEVYENVMGELEDYFGSRPEYVPPSKNYKNGHVKLKLNKSKYFDFLKDFVNENRKYYSTNFGFYGYYLSMLQDEEECFRAFAPDYADWGKTKKNINSSFPDYF